MITKLNHSKKTNMKKQFVIRDLTATDKKYIGENGVNVNLVENAKIYESENEAKKVIDDNNWQSWAWVENITEDLD